MDKKRLGQVVMEDGRYGIVVLEPTDDPKTHRLTVVDADPDHASVCYEQFSATETGLDSERIERP